MNIVVKALINALLKKGLYTELENFETEVLVPFTETDDGVATSMVTINIKASHVEIRAVEDNQPNVSSMRIRKSPISDWMTDSSNFTKNQAAVGDKRGPDG